MNALTLTDAALAFGGTLLYPDCRFSRVSTDSRTLAEGELFVALRGERFDAHDFLEEVALRACGLVVERPDKRLNVPQWVVPDTTAALADLARLARDRFDGRVVAVTGSSGKTSVKGMIASILAGVGPTHATRGNLNNHIGVPLTLLGLEAKHRFAVIEMGANAPGNIAYLCDIARPHIALINNVMPAHLEGFGSVAAIADAKGEIYTALPATGTAVLNLDEPWVDQWRRSLSCADQLTFSLTRDDADFTVKPAGRGQPAGGERFTLVTPKGEAQVSLPLKGRHNIANALAAAACAYAAGADLKAIVAGLMDLETVPGRMTFAPGKGGAQIIDDSYNANPGSVKAALDVLADLDGTRIAVLGDMAELGAGAAGLHREVGEYARQKGIDRLLAVGKFAGSTVSGFGEGAKAWKDKAALVDELLGTLDNDVTVLVKGSRSAAMEDVVAALVEGER